jgi:hypothetical protein
MSSSASPQKNLVTSALATAVAEIATLPICTIKTQYQNGNESKSVVATVKHLYEHGGIRSFYRASFPAISSQMFTTSCKYTMYRALQASNLRIGSNAYVNNVLHGCLSGVLSTLITHPMDAVKIHWQMGAAFGPVWRTIGWRVFYRGYTKSLGKVLVGSSTFLPIYDTFMSNTNHPLLSSVSSAAISGILMQPLDYLKTRQLYGNDLNRTQSRLGQIKQCYRGVHLNLLRIVPHFGITMCTIEWLKAHF